MIRAGGGQRERDKEGRGIPKTSEGLLKSCTKLKGCGGEEREEQASQKYRDIGADEMSPLLRQRSPLWGFASGVTVH